MGPPPRSFAAMRITASWSGPLAHRIQGCGRSSSTTRGLPSNVVIPTTASVPSCSEPSRTSLAVALRAILDRSCARRSSRCVWVGTKKRAARSNKETGGRRKWIGPLGHPLDKRLPIQGISSRKVNSGEVVVRAIGSDLHMDYTAVGHTPHLAARMEQVADPGAIVIAPDTLALVEGYVEVK